MVVGYHHFRKPPYINHDLSISKPLLFVDVLKSMALRLPTRTSRKHPDDFLKNTCTSEGPKTNSVFASENRLCREQSKQGHHSYFNSQAPINQEVSCLGPFKVLGMIKLKLLSEFAKTSMPLKTSINSCGYHCISKPNFA